MAIERLSVGIRLEDKVVTEVIKKAQSMGLSMDLFVEKLVKDWYASTLVETKEIIIPTDVTKLPVPEFPKLAKKKKLEGLNLESDLPSEHD